MAPLTPKSRITRVLESPTEPGSSGLLSPDLPVVPRQSVSTRLQRRRSSNARKSERRRRDSLPINPDDDGFEFDPLDGPDADRGESDDHDKSANGENMSQNKEESGKSEEEEEIQKRKEVGQLAFVFLEVRKGIMSELNIDVSHNDKLEHEREQNKCSRPRKIPKFALQRAERVKLMFNLYYLGIFNAQKVTNPQYTGVDGVYNPLQIIRNRKIRKKYHQEPHIPVKTLPLASTAFSKSNRKLIWELDAAELTYDTTWRTQHWHKLVDAKGDIWFPEDPKLKKHHGRFHHHHHRHKNNHDGERDTDEDKQEEDESHLRYSKLFDSVPGGELEDDDKDRVAIETTLKSSRSSSKSDLLEIPRSGRRKRDRIVGKIRSRSPFKKQQSEEIENISGSQYAGSVSSASHGSKKSDAAVHQTEQTSLSSQQDFKILNDIEIEPIKPTIKVSPDTPDTESEEVALSSAENASSKIQEVVDLIDDSEMEEIKAINSYIDSLRYLNSMVCFYPHELEYKKAEYENLIDFDRIDKQMDRIDANYYTLKKKSLPKYEETLKGKSDELRDIQNELVNDYSTRIDKMLILSDRTIGEVSTTLSLEIRNLNERFEKVNSSRHKNSQYDETLNFVYWMLEHLVILILWFVWIVVSVLRAGKFLVLMVFKSVSWIIQ